MSSNQLTIQKLNFTCAGTGFKKYSVGFSFSVFLWQKIQGFKNSRIQRFKDSKIQGFKKVFCGFPCFRALVAI